MARIKELYRYLNQLSRGRLSILRTAVTTFGRTRASQAAASLAYYTIFSLFPLLLVIIAAGSFFLSSQTVYEELTSLVQQTFPVSAQLITENLNQVIDARGAVGAVGLLTLLWSASGMFSNLGHNVAVAWPKAARRNFVQIQLSGIVMAVGLSTALVISLGVFAVAGFVPFGNAASPSYIPQGVWRMLTSLGTALLMFPFFLGLYRWVPAKGVIWRAAASGALATCIGWQAGIWGFTWYLQSGLNRYQVIYGSLGAIVALLFLIYLLSIIILFGAHLTSAIDHWHKSQKEAEEMR